MMSNAPTNAVKHIMSNIALARSQQYSLLIGSNDIVRYDVMLFPAVCWTKCHSDGLTYGLSMRQLMYQQPICRSI